MGAGRSRQQHTDNLVLGTDINAMGLQDSLSEGTTVSEEDWDVLVKYGVRNLDYSLGNINALVSGTGAKYRVSPIDPYTRTPLQDLDAEGVSYETAIALTTLKELHSAYLTTDLEKYIQRGSLVDNFAVVSNLPEGGITSAFSDNSVTSVYVSKAFTPSLLGSWSTTVGEASSGVTAHEYGHALYNAMGYTKKGGAYAILLDSFERKTSKYEGTSVYASANKEEAFAEAFSLYARGKTYSRVGDKYYQEFKSFMSSAKLDNFFGSATYEKVYSTVNKNGKSYKSPRGSQPIAFYVEKNFLVVGFEGKSYRFIVDTSREHLPRGFIRKIDGVKYKFDLKDRVATVAEEQG